MITFNWEHNQKRFCFSCLSDGEMLDPDSWANHELKLPTGLEAHIGGLLLLLEQEKAAIVDNRIIVPDADLTELPQFQLLGLGLPPLMPFLLSIKGRGIITSKDFCFEYSLRHPDTRPVMGFQREGALITVGGRLYLIPQPYLRVIEAMDEFNARTGMETVDRFLIWSELKEILPPEALQDDYLRQIEIFRADSFSLQAELNAQGALEIAPVLFRATPSHDDLDPNTHSDHVSALPPVCQQVFSNQFRKSRDVKGNYAVSQGRYCVIAPELKKGLEVVRSMADKPDNVRREFLANPRVFLREHLEDLLPEIVLESLFRETTEYSERVLQIGVWRPPVMPVFKKASEPWLPPEEFGLSIGGRHVDIAPDEIPNLIEKIHAAIDEGIPTVQAGDQPLPATQDTISALQALQAAIQEDLQPTEPPPPEDPPPLPENDGPIALIIDRHLERVGKPLKRRVPIDPPVSRDIQGLRSSLLPHQTEGVHWLQDHWQQGSRGALLADDMGLGKTYQVLAFL
ncbi:MAG TPA: hypothetical protein PKM25_11910, partial [Candidatus Ozemobacteraceae bacterium]|nr:hypothetical protein [Candidatus Ozemobacteraceae bacterium]